MNVIYYQITRYRIESVLSIPLGLYYVMNTSYNMYSMAQYGSKSGYFVIS